MIEISRSDIVSDYLMELDLETRFIKTYLSLVGSDVNELGTDLSILNLSYRPFDSA